MAHPTTVAQIKSGNRGRRLVLNDSPSGNGPTRYTYDRLFEHPGKWVTFSAGVDFGWTSFSNSMRGSHPNYIADYLERTYGLDVRRRKTPDSHFRAKCDLMLAGEWFGRVYLDYVTNPELAKHTQEDER